MANNTNNQAIFNALNNVFALFPSYNAKITQLSSPANELFCVTTTDPALKEIFILAKDITPGGGANSLSRPSYELRAQIYASNNNFICDKVSNGDIGIILGMINYKNQIMLAAFETVYSTGNGTISKQIKIDTIDKASIDGFCEQKKKSGDHVYAFKPDFLIYYFKNLKNSIFNRKPKPIQQPPADLAKHHNLIYFGAPGTGKSYLLDKNAKKLCPNGEYERVTFHPDYSYAQFVGTYKPIKAMNPNATSANGQPGDYISYEFVPGPFLRVLVDAMNNEGVSHLLIIEEINRANVAAVFGDVFQLLDRKDGISEYPINMSEDMKAFLIKNVGGFNSDVLSLPSNMYIWASMNSADQGVFPMDTAFKRRWDFEYVGINDGEDAIKQYNFDINGKTINWNELRKAINCRLLKMKLNEDKLIGPFFISLDILNAGADDIVEAFKGKVLMYLFDDAVRHKRSELFVPNSEGDILYSDLCNRFDVFDVGIFKELGYTPSATPIAPYALTDPANPDDDGDTE